jgi:hypothetical protein
MANKGGVKGSPAQPGHPNRICGIRNSFEYGSDCGDVWFGIAVLDRRKTLHITGGQRCS